MRCTLLAPPARRTRLAFATARAAHPNRPPPDRAHYLKWP